jgi:hypothetical protein
MKTRALSFVAVLIASLPLRSVSAQTATVTVAGSVQSDGDPELAQILVTGPGFSREAVASREALLVAVNNSGEGAPIGEAAADLGAMIAFTLRGSPSGPVDNLALVYSFTESAFCNTMPARAFNLVTAGTIYTVAVEGSTVLERRPSVCNLTCESGLPKLACPVSAAIPERMVARSTPLLVRPNGSISLRMIRDDFNFLMVNIPFEFAPGATNPFPFFFNPRPDVDKPPALATPVEDRIFAMGLPRLGIPIGERVTIGYELETFRRTTVRITTPPAGQIVDLSTVATVGTRGPRMRGLGIATVRGSGPLEFPAPKLDRGQPGSATFGFPLKSALASVVVPPGVNPTNLTLEFSSGFLFPVSAPTECNDGIDNDGDGLTDFPADCSDPLAARETSVIDSDFDLIADDVDTCPTVFNPFQDIPAGAVGCRAR